MGKMGQKVPCPLKRLRPLGSLFLLTPNKYLLGVFLLDDAYQLSGSVKLSVF